MFYGGHGWISPLRGKRRLEETQERTEVRDQETRFDIVVFFKSLVVMSL